MQISHIGRSSNKEADNLTNIGSQCLPIPIGVFWEEISERSIKTGNPSGPKKTKEKLIAGSGAETTPGDQDDAPEPKDVIMIKVT
jgi:hypothetical protein